MCIVRRCNCVFGFWLIDWKKETENQSDPIRRNRRIFAFFFLAGYLSMFWLIRHLFMLHPSRFTLLLFTLLSTTVNPFFFRAKRSVFLLQWTGCLRAVSPTHVCTTHVCTTGLPLRRTRTHATLLMTHHQKQRFYFYFLHHMLLEYHLLLIIKFNAHLIVDF